MANEERKEELKLRKEEQQRQAEDELQKQYEQEQYEEMIREQQRQDYEEELERQQEELYQQQMEEEAQREYEEDLRREQQESQLQQQNQLAPQTTSVECTDSDAGKDYYTKGFITHGDGTKEYDKCDTANVGYEDNAIEFYCTSSGTGQTNFKCPYGCYDGKCNSQPEPLAVSSVIDGDTIKLSNGNIVRLTCIDTPETNEPGWEGAKNYLSNLILNKKVSLEKDVSETD